MEKNPNSEIHDWDWEVVVVPNSEENRHSSTNSSPSPPLSGGDGDGVIRMDYFSLDSEHNYVSTSVSPLAAATEAYWEHGITNEVSCNEGEGEQSNNPSLVDACDSVIGENIGGRSRKPTSSPPSSDYSDRNLLYLIHPHSECGRGFDCQNRGFSEFEHLGFSDNFPKSSEIVQNNGEKDVEVNSLIGSDKDGGDERQKQEQHGVDEDEKKREESKNNEKKRVAVWWKVPLEVLKYCVVRVSPVWSLSMAAAALMGFVLLRRRYLHKIKRKSKGVQVNVIVDDEKATQFMSRAACLNEAFSMVKRVPIIRPALPSPGVASWQVMSLR